MPNALAPLYCQYPNQTGPQPAYLQVDDDGEISLDYSGEIGNAVPMAVWHGLVSRYAVSALLSAQQVAGLLADETVVALAARVHAGRTERWDGSNYVGVLSDDAVEASEQLTQYLSEIEGAADVQDVGDYLALYTPTGAPDEAEQIEAAAESDGVVLVGDVARWLADLE